MGSADASFCEKDLRLAMSPMSLASQLGRWT
jgi:hypothetical protein